MNNPRGAWRTYPLKHSSHWPRIHHTESKPLTYDLSVKNPNKNDEVVLREPSEIIEEIMALDKESETILGNIRELL